MSNENFEDREQYKKTEKQLKMKTRKLHLIILILCLLYLGIGKTWGQTWTNWPGGSGTETIISSQIKITGTSYYKMNNNAAMAHEILVDGGTLYLDLNGKYIRNGGTNNSANRSPIRVANGGKIIISDSNPNVAHNGSVTNGVWSLNSSGTDTIKGGVIYGANMTGKSGGAIIVTGDGSVEMQGGTIAGNQVTRTSGEGGIGGGIYIATGTLTLKGGKIMYNSAYNGGGVYVNNASGHHSNLALNSGSIDHNTATHQGGGVYFDGNENFNMTGGTISNNSASNYGGGVVYNNGTFNMKAGTVEGNTSGVTGGGVIVLGARNFTMGDSGDATKKPVVKDNTANGNYGGGVYVDNGASLTAYNATISGNTINDNNSANNMGKGGGVFVGEGGTLSMTNCTITGNHADRAFTGSINGQIIGGAGGGIWLHPSVTATLENCTISNNTAYMRGAGIYVRATPSSGSLTLKGCTITGNSLINSTNADSGGAGIYKIGTLTVSGDTEVTGNLSGSAANNVFIPSDASQKYINIGTSGLSCGSRIGVTKTHDLSTDSNTGKYTEIARGADGNCWDAYNRYCFFDDKDEYSVFGFQTNTSSYVKGKVYFIETWLKSADAAGISTSGDGNTITVNTAAGLAYIAKQVKGGNNYSGKTILLSADISLTGHYWEPIGAWVETTCTPEPADTEYPFLGTFDGQGHAISNAKSILPTSGMGVFGFIKTGSVVKNTFAEGSDFSCTSSEAGHSVSGLVGRMFGGTVYNCGTINVQVTARATDGHAGGLVGSAANSSNIHSCYVINPTVSSGSYQGGMIGALTGASLKNSFANTTMANGLVGLSSSSTVENCYVRGTSGLVGSGLADYCYASSGSASGTNGVYTAATSTYPYLYRDFDEQVTASNSYVPTRSNKQLTETLNNWVDAQTDGVAYSRWVRPTTAIINDDYPVLRMNDFYAVASSTGTNNLYYGTATGSTNNLLSTYKTASDAICLYKSLANISDNTSGTSAKLYIDPDVAVTQAGNNNAYVGVWLDNTAGIGGAHPSQGGTDAIDWHLFSSALEDLPLGFTYNTAGYTPGHGNTPPAVTFTTPQSGYFPTNLGSYYSEWDFYSYSEPDYHWVNMKRASDDHWHSDYDYWQIHYNNETTFVSGRGYLVATAQDCFLQAYGKLKKGDGITHPLSYTADIAYTTRNGFNVLGNPYQSYLDFDQFAHTNSDIWEGGVTKSGYIIMDEDQGGYVCYSHGASENHYGADRYIHPHQGFIVMAGKTGLTATFNENMRSVTGTASFRDQRPNYPLVNLIVTEESGNRDLCTVELGRPDKGGLVKAKGVKSGKGSIYSHYDDEDWAIVFTQPGISEVGIRFDTPEDDTFTLTWDTENGDFHYLHLIDNKTGSDIDCLTTDEYRFTAKADDYSSRFRLVFGYTGIDEPEENGASTGSETSNFAFMMGNQLVVNGEGTLRLYDVTGRMMMENIVSGTQTVTLLPNVVAGVYVLQLAGSNGMKYQKIVIR